MHSETTGKEKYSKRDVYTDTYTDKHVFLFLMLSESAYFSLLQLF